MGMLTADENSNILDPKAWKKSSQPVFESDIENGLFGPGHNSFTLSEDNQTDLMVYHIRNYTDIKGDPLYDPNRHTVVQDFTYDTKGYPRFEKPQKFIIQ
ncbi:alpha-N-arabinofuranosidase [Lactococcus cremoris]|uniref:Alpha-N-arabinofuranosidase n=1 Tax=Lactococcus lactis subsp. cremoris TaxID=1359 RepID=A0ABR5EJY5_LACLC|nr:alpha-N-arabinofuranosidase [Lactococcus cremoris]KZK34572.1 Alpha-L-arabinofuranosidase II precursor [Lactococcus cremoris]